MKNPIFIIFAKPDLKIIVLRDFFLKLLHKSTSMEGKNGLWYNILYRYAWKNAHCIIKNVKASLKRVCLDKKTTLIVRKVILSWQVLLQISFKKLWLPLGKSLFGSGFFFISLVALLLQSQRVKRISFNFVWKWDGLKFFMAPKYLPLEN